MQTFTSGADSLPQGEGVDPEGYRAATNARWPRGLRRVALPPGDRGGAGGDEGSKGVAAAGASSPGLGYGLDTTSAISNLRRIRAGTRSDGALLNFRRSQQLRQLGDIGRDPPGRGLKDWPQCDARALLRSRCKLMPDRWHRAP